MASNHAVTITTPVGRLVQGNLVKGNDKNSEGVPLIYKSGPNAGQPRNSWFIALAIPKGSEQHWSQTEWGAKIWQVGHACFPNVAQNPTFAWKVVDGDSQIPDLKGVKPCDREGFKGHWVLKFSNGFAPKVFEMVGAAFVEIPVDQVPNKVKNGYYVQVNAQIDGNGSMQKPGVYLNHGMVCLRGFGPEIVSGPDAAAAGFGQAALPAGASAIPVGGAMPQAPQVPGNVPAPLIPGVAPSPASVVSPIAPVVAVPPIAPSVPVSGQQYQMTAAAQGAPREAFIAQGWTDAALIQNGYMIEIPPGSVPSVPAPAPTVVAPGPVVTPDPSILAVPTPVVRQMTAKAGGAPRDAFIANGWTDEMLIAQGFMTA